MTEATDITTEPSKRMNRRRLAVILAVAAVFAALAAYGITRALDDAPCACDHLELPPEAP